MVITVSVVVVVGMVAMLAAGAALMRRFTNWWKRTSGTSSLTLRDQPNAFGALPDLAGTVGPLGLAAPDADLSSNASDAEAIYGE